MKAKTIKQVLRRKVDAWLSTIDDPATLKVLSGNVIVTGGCIASMLLGEDVNDYDIYFRTKAAALAAAHYYVKKFEVKNAKGVPCAIYVDDNDDRVRIIIKSSGIASEDGAKQPYEYFENSNNESASGYVGAVMQDPGEIEDVYQDAEAKALESEDEGKPLYRPVFMSTNAITLSHRVQLVLRFFGEPDEIHKNYDFVHCTNYWTSWDNALTLRQPALEALLARELRYVGSKYPIASIIRLRKFIKRGWTINAGQILKMAMQISDLDLKDLSVLEDQLTGVDVAYFIEVVNKLRDKDPEKVNSAYLIEIIDRLF